MHNSIFNQLVNLYHEHKLGHAYLIETNDVEKCFYDIKEMVKNIACKKENNSSISHLIDNNELPSLIVISPDGKNIKKEPIELLKKAFSLKPIYTEDNYYIIKYPEKMNTTSFNMLLKFLEEPENNIYGFLICQNKDMVAPTIVSRCELIRHNYHEVSLDEDLYNEALEYIKKIENSKENILWYNNTEIFKKEVDREYFINFFKNIYQIYFDAYKNPGKYPFKSNIEKLNIIKKYLEQLNFNVNINLVLDSFCLEIGEVNEK